MFAASSWPRRVFDVKRIWHRHEYLSIGLLWAAIVIALFWQALTSGPERVLGGNDASYLFVPWLRFAAGSVRQGVFPLWNPYLFGGTPFVGNPQPALFYPTTWLAAWLGPERTVGWSTALHVWVAALGMYAWLRAMDATRGGAFYASVAYALSGFVTTRIWAGHFGVLMGAAWLPVVLWAMIRALRLRSAGWAVVGGLPFGLMGLTGHTQTIVLLALAAALIAGFESVRAARRSRDVRAGLAASALFGVTALVGVALCAVQALPTLTLIQNSARVAGRSPDLSDRFSLPPGQLLSMLVPDAFGEPASTGYWGAPVFEEYVYYVGVPTLILAALSIFSRDTRARFLVAFGCFGLLAALGPNGLLYRLIPFFDLFRAPARAAMWAVLGFSAAAGLCLSALQTSDNGVAGRVRSKGFLIASGLVIAAGLAGAGLAFARFSGFSTAPEVGWMRDLSGDLTVFALLFAATSIALRLWLVRPARASPWAAAVALLLLLDLGAYHVKLVRMAPKPSGAPYAAAQQIVGRDLEQYRLIWVYANLFELNLGMDFGQPNVYGYDPLIVARFQAMVDRVNDLSSPIYDMLNVRYVISPTPLSEKVERVAQQDGFILYERPHAAPRAWIVHAVEIVEDDEAALNRIAADFDPQLVAVAVGSAPCAVESHNGPDGVAVTRYELNRIETRIDAASAGLLVFSEIDYPGWVASIDGVPAEIHRVNYGLRGLCAPRGSHTVAMVYDPPELKAGMFISALAGITIAGAGVALLRRNSARG